MLFFERRLLRGMKWAWVLGGWECGVIDFWNTDIVELNIFLLSLSCSDGFPLPIDPFRLLHLPRPFKKSPHQSPPIPSFLFDSSLFSYSKRTWFLNSITSPTRRLYLPLHIHLHFRLRLPSYPPPPPPSRPLSPTPLKLQKNK